MAFFGRKLKSTEVPTTAKKAKLRSVKSTPLVPPPHLLGRSATFSSSEGNSTPRKRDAQRTMNNTTLDATSVTTPEPYLDPIVTKRSQRPLTQVTCSGSQPIPGPNPSLPIRPPKILTASRSPAAKLARSQSDSRPGGAFDRGELEKRRLERKKQRDLAYLVVDLPWFPSSQGPSQKQSTPGDKGEESLPRQRTMSVPHKPIPIPRASISSGSSPSGSLPSKPVPRNRDSRSPSLPRASSPEDGAPRQPTPEEDDPQSTPTPPPRRKRSVKTPSSLSPNHAPPPNRLSVPSTSAKPDETPPNRFSMPTGGSKPKPKRPPPPSSAALLKAKEMKARSLSMNRTPPTTRTSLTSSLTITTRDHRSMTVCTEHSAVRPEYEEIDHLGINENALLPPTHPPPKLSQRGQDVVSLPPKSHSKPKLVATTECTEHSAVRPEYEDIDHLGINETVLPPPSHPPPQLSQRGQDNVLPLPPKSNSSKSKPVANRTISTPIPGSLVHVGCMKSRSSSVPSVESGILEEEDVGGGIYEPVNPSDPLLTWVPPLPARNPTSRLSSSSSKLSPSKTDTKRGRTTSLSPNKRSLPAIAPHSDPVQRRRPPPPRPQGNPLATSVTSRGMTRANSGPDVATLTGNPRSHDQAVVDSETSRVRPIYEDIDQGYDQGDATSTRRTSQPSGGSNVLPLPPKPEGTSKLGILRKQQTAPEVGGQTRVFVGEYTLAMHPKTDVQDTGSGEEPDVGGIEEYVEMNPQNGWEGEPPQTDRTVDPQDKQDEGGDSYVEMHPVTSVCQDHTNQLPVGSTEATPEEEEEEEEEDVGGEEIYIEMNPREYMAPPELHYASRDIVGARPDLQAEFLKTRASTTTQAC